MALRIIGGDFRRRQLKTPPTRDTRPYTDRVRQIVFDRIPDLVENARVADVFAGVGTMGLEALSRGAATCVFIEFDTRVFRVLTENVDSIASEKDTLCWKTNIHRTSFRPNGVDRCLPYSLVFFDPPYAQCSLLKPGEALDRALQRLAKEDVTTGDAVIILRTPGQFEFSECVAWNISDCWRISTMNLWILRKPTTGETGRDEEDRVNRVDSPSNPREQSDVANQHADTKETR